jgi:very-short-patch-repair endonuclease
MERRTKSTARIRGTTEVIDMAALALRQRMAPAGRRAVAGITSRPSQRPSVSQAAPARAVCGGLLPRRSRLVVEVDGEIHRERADSDAARTQQ